MLTVNIRDLSRSPKRVFEEVKKTNQPRQVVNQKEPQAIIVSLETFKEFEQLKSKQKQQGSAMALLKLVQLGEKYPSSRKTTNALEEIDKMWQERDK